MKRLLMCLVVGLSVRAADAAVWNVQVEDFQFTPAQLTILQGDTVVWTNTGGFHNVRHICEPQEFANEPADAPWQYQHVFNTAVGSYPYICDVHPEMMTGTITVQRRGRWNVTVRSFSFTPQHITITQGDTVTWSNVSGFHNIHHNATPSLFGNSAANAPWTYSYIFNLTSGTYPYICQVHPTMMGSVTVTTALPLPAPEQLVTYPQGGEIMLQWQPVCGADRYRVSRSADAAAGVYPDLVGETTATTLSDPLAGGTNARFFYYVQAVRD